MKYYEKVKKADYTQEYRYTLCDKCGEKIGIYDGDVCVLTIDSEWQDYGDVFGEYNHADLCKKCEEEITDYLMKHFNIKFHGRFTIKYIE